MGMEDVEVQNVFIAALLHGIGKIGLPDRLFEKPFVNLTGEEHAEVIKHPVKGQVALMALEQLHVAARLIRSHRERFDGLGYPDGLAGQDIPLGARILALVYDYDAVQLGKLLSKRLNQSEAIAYIQEGRGKRYDPAVVDAFIVTAGVKDALPRAELELIVNSRQLKPGMSLSRDILTTYGAFMLAKDCILNESLIVRIRKFEREVDSQLIIHIHAPE
jgi:response regulator RpfG family c-di-GMP phosphodiesterase